jgi:hypothetical protein
MHRGTCTHEQHLRVHEADRDAVRADGREVEREPARHRRKRAGHAGRDGDVRYGVDVGGAGRAGERLGHEALCCVLGRERDAWVDQRRGDDAEGRGRD